MRYHPIRPFVLGVVGALCLGVPHGSAHAADETSAPFPLTRVDLDRLRNQSASTILLPLPGGGRATLRLVPFDLLGPEARITATSREGVRALPKDAVFLRGTVEGDDSGWAAFVLTAGGLRGHVQLGRRLLGIAPALRTSTGDVTHAVQNVPDSIEGAAGRCGIDGLPAELQKPDLRRAPQLGSGPRPGIRLTCDVAVDCDYEFYRLTGDVNRTIEGVLAMFAAVTTVYERDVDVGIRLSYLNVWTTPDDPYLATSYDALEEFRDWWNANRADVPRHLAHLLSGRDFVLFGGIAYLNVLCDGAYGYGLTSANSFGVFTLAHEIGHNFGSFHTQSCFWQDIGLAPAGALLDSCVASEGDCYTGPTGIEPPTGGTIMSYCDGKRIDFHPVCSSWMRERAEFSCLPADSVQPPRNVTVLVQTTSVTLQWEPGGSADVIRYDVYRSGTPLDPAPVLIGSTTSETYVDGRIRANTYYKLRSVRVSDESGFSREALGVPLPDQPPLISAPESMVGHENEPLMLTVSVTDPELDPIQSLTTSPLPEGAVFTLDAGGAGGMVRWTPACLQAGEYTILFSAYSGATGTATTRLTIQPVDCPPILSVPPEVAGQEGQALEVEVTASDREGDPIVTLTAIPMPEGATFTTSADLGSGLLRWTPGFTQAGVYEVTFQASSGMPASASTRIVISDVNRPPLLSFSASASAIPGMRITVPITAADLDGEGIDHLTAEGLPAGAVFTASPTNETATLEWIPQPGQEGSHAVSITAANTLTTTSTLRIDVHASADQPPIVGVPATASGMEGAELTVEATASDPDGDDLISLQSGPLPRGAAFVSETPAHGTLIWTPDFEQAGSYAVTLSAVSISRASPVSAVELTGWASILLGIANVDRAPVVTAPSAASVAEGVLLELSVSAADPDGDPLGTLSADLSSLPLGHDAVFSVAGDLTGGTLRWTPSFRAAGEYEVVIVAANGLAGSARTRIVVLDANQPPSADAGGPYSGFVSVSLGFDGSGSSDPDGSPLSYHWGFGDGSQAVGPAPEHTYALAGEYPVVLTVSDGSLEGSDETSASIAGFLEATAFTAPAHRTIRLQSGKPTWCARVEPPAGSFPAGSIDLTAVSLEYGGAEIPALHEKMAEGDSDGDGISEISICFSKADLRVLFSDLGEGTSQVVAMLRGKTLEGGIFRAPVHVEVVVGSALAASVAPNPLHRGGTLTFATRRAGAVTVNVFDLQGRLVRTLVAAAAMPAGVHDIRIEQTRAKALPSGVYFYRIHTPDGTITGRFAVTR